MNYKASIYSTVQSYFARLDSLQAGEAELLKQEQAETISRVRADQCRAEIRKQRSDAHEAAVQQIEQARKAHAEAVDKWNALSGDKLDKDAELLKLDIPMNQTQFQQLCTKHKDNSLMLALLCQYADKHKDAPLYADRPADAATRKADFSAYADRAVNVCREPNSIRAGMFLDNVGVPDSCTYEY